MGADPHPPGPSRPGAAPSRLPEVVAPVAEIGRYERLRPCPGPGLRGWFEAEDRWSGAAVSLLATAEGADDPSTIPEVAAAAEVDHAAVVAPIQVVRSTTGWLLVTHHVEGEALDELVARRGPVHGDRLVVLAADLFAGLAAIHRAGVVHGAVDGGHVVIGSHGQIRIIGLGLAAIGPTGRCSPQEDLFDALSLLRHVGGDRPLPVALEQVLEGIATGQLDAAAARDALLPPIDLADAAREPSDPRPGPTLAPRPWWVRVLAGLLVVTALGGLVLVASSLLADGPDGGRPTAVPDVVGLPLASAQQVVEGAGFTTDVQLQAAPDAPRGGVLAQRPRGGLDAPRGSRVVLVVATGADDAS